MLPHAVVFVTADAGADEDVGEEEAEDDAEDENIAAAQGHAAIQAASEAASDGITGSTSAQHMIELLLQLPDSQRAAEDAAAASGKGLLQNDKWAKLNEQLSKVVQDAAEGKKLQIRRGDDDKYQQLHAELLQLQEELPMLESMVLSNRTWEVSCSVSNVFSWQCASCCVCLSVGRQSSCALTAGKWSCTSAVVCSGVPCTLTNGATPSLGRHKPAGFFLLRCIGGFFGDILCDKLMVVLVIGCCRSL